MNESFESNREPIYETQKDWHVVQDRPGEETVINHEGGGKFDIKTLRNTMHDLENRVKELEDEGWEITKRGSDFVVLQRIPVKENN